jgi:hypothetical protein
VAVGHFFQLLRVSIGRKSDDQALVRKPLAHLLNGRGEVAVARDDDGCVKTVVKCIAQQLDGDVDIGHFFFVIGPGGSARFARPGFGQVMAFVFG